ncbi:hypothetical protein OOK58_58220 [Streptomyces sp. NBC_01728]|nr:MULTISPECIES: hypothetical protein [unclassified Streptomyces]MCX4462252.1 hypothetical protein [Streptomyces sp. NBC_01719]MCX4500690.1 hypothetical protein [Streptomyces sp. NBC_01728]
MRPPAEPCRAGPIGDFDGENGHHIDDPSEDALFDLISELNDADNTFTVIQQYRKRAGGLTDFLARALRARGREVEVEHLHVRLPRVLKTATSL